MIVYLHCFNSSPQSHKARVMAAFMAERGLGSRFVFGVIPNDFVQGLLKPFVFGAIIAVTACYFGLRTTGGTEGVGQSTTKTVVTSSILILVADYFLTQLLLSIMVVP